MVLEGGIYTTWNLNLVILKTTVMKMILNLIMKFEEMCLESTKAVSSKHLVTHLTSWAFKTCMRQLEEEC